MAVDTTKLAERLRDPGLEFEEDVAPLLADAVELMARKQCDKCCYPPEMCDACLAIAAWIERVAEAAEGEE